MQEIVLRGRGPNTLSLALLEELDRALEDAGDRPILVTGAGQAFSAGLDLDALAKADAAHVSSLLRTMERAVRRLFLHPAPTVAFVNGHAIAGGCLIAQCCDLRVGIDDPDIRIGMTGVAVGLTYPPFVLAVLRYRLPALHLENVLLGSRRYTPREALAMGLLDELAGREQARALAETRLAERNRLPRSSYAATKLTLRAPALVASVGEQERFEREVLPAWTNALLRRS
jgi:enoyl-CoA hydratase/carnithine racemase